MKQGSDVYPQFSVVHIQNPSRLYAVPLLGGLMKLVICIPQYIILMFLGIAFLIVGFIVNPFVVLFTGKYWDVAYKLVCAMQTFSMKVTLYFFGLTNEYPGFSFEKGPDFTLEIPFPEKPNKLFAIPVFGGLARAILMIPFNMYAMIIQYAAMLGAVGSSFVVLFTGKYPESMYELVRDSQRLSLASGLYTIGIYDAYPSFWISLTHKNIKIALIALVAIYTIFYYIMYFGTIIGGVMSGSFNQSPTYRNQGNYNNLPQMPRKSYSPAI